MEEQGDVEVLESTRGVALNMLNGEKNPENVKALRMLTKELLWHSFKNAPNLSLTAKQNVKEIGPCIRHMIPLFLATGHFNYARYGLFYL